MEADARARGPGSRFADVRRHAEVRSTNDVAAELARRGAAEGVVVVADHQTAGRGRWGRSWTSAPGSSLLVSVVLRPRSGNGPPALLSLAGGLAAADACVDAGGFRPDLKWPNDVVVGDRKLAGILAELVADPAGGPPAVVVGLGLNLRWVASLPPELAAGAVAADEVAGRPVERDALLDAFLARLEERCHQVSDASGREQLLDEFTHRCVTLGRQVRVELPGGSVVEGHATGVSPEGLLAVRTPEGPTHVLAAGEVLHVRPIHDKERPTCGR